jgi:predicted double-glycine peptidase
MYFLNLQLININDSENNSKKNEGGAVYFSDAGHCVYVDMIGIQDENVMLNSIIVILFQIKRI